MIRYFAKHPTAANLLMFLFVVLGIMSIASLRRETFPDFAAAKVEIKVIYPGATAEDVEEGLCQRIEDAIDEINFVEEVVSEARESMGVVVVEMQEDGNISEFLDDIKTEIDAIDDFPLPARSSLLLLLSKAFDRFPGSFGPRACDNSLSTNGCGGCNAWLSSRLFQK